MTRATRILSVLPALLLGVFVMSTAHAWAQAGPVGASVQQYSGGVRWPDVAYDSYNRVFLVVWGPGTIRGIFVSEDGNAIGSSFRISDSTPWAQTPRAVFNPDTGVFLVAWQSSDGIEGNANATVVRGRMVSYTSGVSALPTKAYSAATYSTRWETGPALAYSTALERRRASLSLEPSGQPQVRGSVADAESPRRGLHPVGLDEVPPQSSVGGGAGA